MKKDRFVGSVRHFLVLSLIATAATSYAATWSRSYGRPDLMERAEAVPSTDGGFIVVAETSNPPGDGAGFWVAKLDSAGGVVWQKSIDGERSLNRNGELIAATPDGGAVLTARENGEMIVVKFSSNGAVEWKGTYTDYAGTNGGTAVTPLSAGGYAVVGYDGSSEGVILRLDAGGGIVWARTLVREEPTDRVFPVSVIETSGGDLVVVAATNVSLFGGKSNAVFKLHSTGTLLWRYRYDDLVGSGYLVDVAEAGNGDLILLGDGDDFADGVHDLWILRVDTSGIPVWQRTLGGWGMDVGAAITATSDGGCVVAAISDSFGLGLTDGWLIKLDGSGSIVWQRVYGEHEGDDFWSVAETPDGSLLVAGTGGTLDASGAWAWVMLLDGAGEFDSPCPLVFDSDAATAGTSAGRTILDPWGATPPVYAATGPGVVQNAAAAYSEHCPCTTCRSDPFENDNACLTSRSILRTGEAQEHNFWDDGSDWLSLNACAGRPYTLETFDLGAAADTVLELFDTDCVSLLEVDDDGGDGLASRLTWVAPHDGLFHIRVAHAYEEPAADREYSVRAVGDTSMCSRWSLALGGAQEDAAEDLVAMTDGTFMVAGRESSNLTAMRPWLFKLDPAGSIQWERSYLVSGEGRFDDARLADTGDAVMLGGQYDDPHALSKDALLVAVDRSGAPTWARTLDTGNAEERVSTLTWGGGAAVSRIASSTQRTVLTYFSSDGTYSGAETPTLVDSDHEVLDCDYLMVGWIESALGDKDAWIWDYPDQIHGGIEDDVATATAHTTDLGFIVVGWTESYGAGGRDVWAIKYMGYSTVAWERTFGGPGDDEGVDVIETRDGDYVIAATTDSFGAGSTDGWLIAVDSSGEVVWQRTYGGSNADAFTSIEQTADDGLVVSGVTSYALGDTREDAWVLRLGPDGDLPEGCPVSGTPSVAGQALVSTMRIGDTFFMDYPSVSYQYPDLAPIAATSASSLQCFGTCENGDGDLYSICAPDCDDTDGAVYPGAVQQCDGVNNDCDDPTWPTVPSDEIDGDTDGMPPCAGDCDDTDPATYAGADEVNDGLDNQCPGDYGYGLVDEISGFTGFTNPGDDDTFCWPAQDGATLYQIARATDDPEFGVGCVFDLEAGNCYTDLEDPPPGSVFYYIVRPLSPLAGSWGWDETGGERVPLCGV